MDIQRFISARKALGYSQKELSDGICTQTTLSRFENNGQIPTVKILIQLCHRLNLGLGELFPEVGVEENELNRQLAQAEFNFILREYQKAEEILEKINSENVFSFPFEPKEGDYLSLKNNLRKYEYLNLIFINNKWIEEVYTCSYRECETDIYTTIKTGVAFLSDNIV